MFAYFGIVFAWFNVSYYLSFIALRLLDLGVSDENVGNCFVALTAPYFISCFTLPIVLKKVKKKHQFLMCFILSSVAYSLMVPLNIYPNEIYVLLIGMGIIGFSQEMIFVNALPEILESLGNVNDNTTDRISGVLNFVGLISQSVS